MMNKLKTARIQLIRFLFVVPLLTVLLISFRSGQKSFNDRQQNFSVTNDTFNSEEIQRQVEEIKAFNNRHPEIEWLYSTEDKTKHIIFLKTGVIERYGYAGTPSMAALEEKYGTLPSIYKEPKLQHVAYLEQWQNISTQAAGQFHSENKNAKHIIFPGDSRVLVQLTNNYVETYDMDYDKDREQFEMTFGKLPDCVPSPSRSDDVIAEERSIVFQDTIPGLNEKGYFVYVTGNKNEATVMVKDRTGKLVESVPYKKWKSNEKFYTDKYGEWPAPPPPAEPPVPPAPPAPIEMPENVRKININNNKATVLLKDGKEEKYDLNKPEEKALFEKKYGEVIPPPAKPPVPPQPPRNADELVATQEVNRATIADEFEITDKKATMQLKDGTVEEYDLSKPADRKKFETKYGKIVTANGRIDGVVAPAKVIGSADGKTFVMPPIPRDRDVVWLNEDRAIIGGEEEILATITNRTTQQQLEDLIKQVKQKGVELKITNTDYDEGKLVSISGTVVSISGTSVLKDASGSFSASDFKKLILSVIKDGEHVYFKVRTTDNKTVI